MISYFVVIALLVFADRAKLNKRCEFSYMWYCASLKPPLD